MKVGDLVRYWKDGTTGLVMAFDGQYYTVLFEEVKLSYISPDELELISEGHNEEDEKPTAYAHTKENCVVYQEGGPPCPDCVETKGNHLEPSGVSLSQDGQKE